MLSTGRRAIIICELHRVDDTQMNNNCIQESSGAWCASHPAPLARLEVTERLCPGLPPREVAVMIPAEKVFYCSSVSKEKKDRGLGKVAEMKNAV